MPPAPLPPPAPSTMPRGSLTSGFAPARPGKQKKMGEKRDGIKKAREITGYDARRELG